MAGIFGFLQFDKVIDGKKSCLKLLQIAKQNFSLPSNYFLDKDENRYKYPSVAAFVNNAIYEKLNNNKRKG